MVSRRTAATLWLVAGLSSAFLVPYMTDQVLLAVFAIGAIVGIVLAAACLLRWGERLARWSAATGAVWLVAFVHDPLSPVSSTSSKPWTRSSTRSRRASCGRPRRLPDRRRLSGYGRPALPPCAEQAVGQRGESRVLSTPQVESDHDAVPAVRRDHRDRGRPVHPSLVAVKRAA